MLKVSTNTKALGITFKDMSNKDMAFVCELYRTTRWDEVMQAPWDEKQKRIFLQQQFEAQHKHYQSHYPHSEFLIIQQDKRAIGRIYLDRDDASICLIDIALLPEYRNQGLGTKLLKGLLSEAQHTQKKVVIHVEKFNPAYQWYLNHGFVQVEDKGVHQYMEWHPKNHRLNNS